MQQEPTSRLIAFIIDASVFAAIFALIPWELKPWYGSIFGSYKILCELIARRSIGQALLGMEVVYARGRRWSIVRNLWWFVPLGFQALVFVKGIIAYLRNDNLMDTLAKAKVLKEVPSAPCPTCA
ncbi:RDD family protein [Corynebacterium kalinowskii]|uniref:RDD family protein n=1 Tax=Corynebacterium kalinowskii TaxID=2675216 RepID=A0A6B8VMB5_9CORY|nr:hypothetical protein [Corynebacterium kalinowskii]QGU02564.1 RDD family protein [Corynebacterium kalinowskii]